MDLLMEQHPVQQSGDPADPQQRDTDTSRQGQRGSSQRLFRWCAPMCFPEGGKKYPCEKVHIKQITAAPVPN